MISPISSLSSALRTQMAECELKQDIDALLREIYERPDSIKGKEKRSQRPPEPPPIPAYIAEEDFNLNKYRLYCNEAYYPVLNRASLYVHMPLLETIGFSVRGYFPVTTYTATALAKKIVQTPSIDAIHWEGLSEYGSSVKLDRVLTVFLNALPEHRFTYIRIWAPIGEQTVCAFLKRLPYLLKEQEQSLRVVLCGTDVPKNAPVRSILRAFRVLARQGLTYHVVCDLVSAIQDNNFVDQQKISAKLKEAFLATRQKEKNLRSNQAYYSSNC